MRWTSKKRRCVGPPAQQSRLRVWAKYWWRCTRVCRKEQRGRCQSPCTTSGRICTSAPRPSPSANSTHTRTRLSTLAANSKSRLGCQTARRRRPCRGGRAVGCGASTALGSCDGVLDPAAMTSRCCDAGYVPVGSVHVIPPPPLDRIMPLPLFSGQSVAS
eukprot:7396179-Pyramimonas_sp.AAC.2